MLFFVSTLTVGTPVTKRPRTVPDLCRVNGYGELYLNKTKYNLNSSNLLPIKGTVHIRPKIWSKGFEVQRYDYAVLSITERLGFKPLMAQECSILTPI